MLCLHVTGSKLIWSENLTRSALCLYLLGTVLEQVSGTDPKGNENWTCKTAVWIHSGLAPEYWSHVKTWTSSKWSHVNRRWFGLVWFRTVPFLLILFVNLPLITNPLSGARNLPKMKLLVDLLTSEFAFSWKAPQESGPISTPNILWRYSMEYTSLKGEIFDHSGQVFDKKLSTVSTLLFTLPCAQISCSSIASLSPWSCTSLKPL